MKAGDIVDRIKKNLGVAWRDTTYRDTFKSGGPDTEVTGIATTAFVTMDVIQRAAAARLNMIIPHEDTFWNDRDDTAMLGADAVYAAKRDLIAKHKIAVFRIHDHMHAQRPDFTYVGSARAIGLDPAHETSPGSHRFVIPETTLGALADGDVELQIVGDLLALAAMDEGAGQQILFHGEMAETVAALHHLDDAAAHQIVGRELVDALAGIGDRTLGDLAALHAQQVGNRFQGGGFAGAIGAQQRHDAALRHALRATSVRRSDALRRLGDRLQRRRARRLGDHERT